MKSAPLAFIVFLAVGFSAGMYFRSEQVSNYLTRIDARDDEIKDLKEKNAELRSKIVPQVASSVNSKPTASVATNEPNSIAVSARKEPTLTVEQLSQIETALKASPSTVKIQKGGKTPKILANQIQGVFNSSGWKIDLNETIDSRNWLLVEVANIPDAKTVMSSLDDSKVGYYSSQTSDGGMTFYINTDSR